MQHYHATSVSFQPTLAGYLSDPQLFYDNHLHIFKKFEDISDFLYCVNPVDYANNIAVRQVIEGLKLDLTKSSSLLRRMRNIHKDELSLTEVEMRYHESNVNKVMAFIKRIQQKLQDFKFTETIAVDTRNDALRDNEVQRKIAEAKMRSRNIGPLMFTLSLIHI